MARSDAVWGIDIGQCALKALRCRPGAEPGTIVADAFDYVEYPKILSQPEAEPAALVHEALTQFLSRNNIRGDKVAMSVPGQSGLARFIKLPPVESKKIPDIVKYEARQQIPFSLDDVVWDYQKMVGGSEEEGFALETEVGLFAMKRDQVYRSLQPFSDAGIEVNFVQLTPLALYNYIAFDQMQDLPPPADYDPDNPPPSVVLLSLGTDSTDLVVTNGYRVWQRSVPIGGNHFTKALTKELKLTFATAEHLKRNAAKAEDPKALFQAMRPVFNDLLTEVQRSIGYFSNLDRRAKIGRVLALGNAMKLPGLQRYLAQNLGYDFQRVENFRALEGPSVVDAPAFKENLLSFGVCYGLALQGLRESAIETNLLPRELIRDRMVRDKKPWAVGAAAALLLGCTLSYFGYWRAWDSTRLKGYFEGPKAAADSVVTKAQGFETKFKDAKTAYKKTADVGQSLLPSADRRQRWLKVWKAVNLCLPTDEGEVPADISQRKTLNIGSFEAQHVDDLATWYASVREFDKAESPLPPPPGADAGAAAAGAADPAAAAAAGEPGAGGPNGEAQPGMPGGQPGMPGAGPGMAGQPGMPPGGVPGAEGGVPGGAPVDAGPSGAGWVVSMRGFHFHNPPKDIPQSAQYYVKKTLIENLKSGKVPLPAEDLAQGEPTEIDLQKLGIAYPVVLPGNGGMYYGIPQSLTIDVPDDSQETVLDQSGMPIQQPTKPVQVARFDFIVQFCWLDEPKLPEPPPGGAGGEGMPGEVPPAAPINATPGVAPGVPAAPVPGTPGAAAPVEQPGAAPADGAPAAVPGDGAPIEGAPPAADGAVPPAGEVPGAPAGDAAPAGDNPTADGEAAGAVPPAAPPAEAPPGEAPPTVAPPAAPPNP